MKAKILGAAASISFLFTVADSAEAPKATPTEVKAATSGKEAIRYQLPGKYGVTPTAAAPPRSASSTQSLRAASPAPPSLLTY